MLSVPPERVSIPERSSAPTFLNNNVIPRTMWRRKNCHPREGEDLGKLKMSYLGIICATNAVNCAIFALFS